ncbi:hypothetical protein DAPPUDRAFT_318703 [Daphnia pulex]|uniref:Uncharacterized protein n=1 Tax=Daphnia pulex TaxID=6669 RepID=E9GK35_DAPPU|nr:hypothetical protein DAPPUDRAFT_318703 [Daphnia pulex]|eukprot:EFX80116.1 hypothetical protein DAPPUDRAFT_318703 [Daphnia pulex]
MVLKWTRNYRENFDDVRRKNQGFPQGYIKGEYIGESPSLKEFHTGAQKQARLAFADAYGHRSQVWGNFVIFSDEKSFGSQECIRSFVYRTNGKMELGSILATLSP